MDVDKLIVFNAIQKLNAPMPIDVTVEGMVSDVKYLF
jgi:hypothetical protein